jgi:ferric enterobactin receptor
MASHIETKTQYRPYGWRLNLVHYLLSESLKMKHVAIAALALAFFASSASAQQPQTPGRAAPGTPPSAGPGEIIGRVMDAESNTPISSASVAVRNAANVLVAGAIARPDGTFRIEGLQPGTYTVRYSMIGYATQTSDAITITPAAARAALGPVKLTRQAVEVSAVEATAERTVIISPDRNSYRAKDVAPAATNASDVLDNVPAVSVDADGKVSLRGNENVVVQINGRPTPIRGAQLAGYLKSLPANTIETIEVVPNPSAKQDPEGMAGIINIVMKQGVDLGTSGGLTAMASTHEQYNVSGNIGHQAGPFALFGTYGFISQERDITGINDLTRFLAVNVPRNFTEQDLDQQSKFWAHNFSFNADYTINKRDVVLATVQANRRGMDDGSLMAYDELDGDRTLVDEYLRLRNADENANMMDGSLSFRRTTPAAKDLQKREFVAEFRFNRAHDWDASRLFRESTTGQTTDIETNDVDMLAKQLTAQIDYTRGLGKTMKLETGYKGNARLLDNDLTVMKDTLGNGQFFQSDLSNQLEFDEYVNAVYAVVSNSGKKMDWQLGLRAEYANRDFTLINTDETFSHDYRSVFPSALVNFKLNDKSTAKASYSRRIRRPGRDELNPFPRFFDLNNVFIGNPELDPEYTDAFEVSYQRSGSLGTLQISPFYRRTSDIIRVEINTADTVSNREVTTVSFTNLDHSDSWGADLNGQFRLSPKLSGLVAFNVFKMVTDGGSQSSLSSNGVNWNARFNANYAMSPATTVIGSYFYVAPMKIERGTFTGRSIVNLSIRQKLSTKSTLTARMSDPFNTMKFGVDVRDDNIRQLTTRHFNNRALFLTYQYNFGQTPKMKQRRQEEQQQGQTGFGN